MRLVLFDLGQTLEDGDVLLPGARETLEQIAAIGNRGAPAVQLGLISDFTTPTSPAEIPAIQREYYAILDQLGIRGFFEPVAQRVTLSTEVGVRKPEAGIFRRAAEKADPALTFRDVLFVTENVEHVRAARRLGMRAVHLRGPGQSTGDIDTLHELVPLVRGFALGPATPATSGAARRDGDEDPVDRDSVDGDSGPAAVVAVTTVQVTPESAAAVVEGVAVNDHWVKFGDQLLVIGSTGADRGSAGARATPGSAVLHPAIRADRLHLVVQNGRLFQQEHPNVQVLVDKGRYLLVDLDPAEARRLTIAHGPCFAVTPIQPDTVVFEQRPRKVDRAGAVSWVQDLVDGVSAAQFRTDLKRLVASGTRFSTHSEFLAAAEATRDDLDALGYTAAMHPIPVHSRTSRNVIAERPGDGPEPRDVVLVTAHLDSINIKGGPAAPAPGADDNASGSAGLMTIARVFAAHSAQLDLRLILFGGEEEGLFGSLHYVAGLNAADRSRIRAVVNMDMIGTLNTPVPTVLLEGGAVSQTVLDGLGDAADAYTTLVVQTSLNPFNSDHVPFIDAAVPAVLTIEGTDSANERIHTANDTMEFVDENLPLEILRMNVGFVAKLLGQG